MKHNKKKKEEMERVPLDYKSPPIEEEEPEEMERVSGPPPDPRALDWYTRKQEEEAEAEEYHEPRHISEPQENITIKVDFSLQRLEVSAPEKSLYNNIALNHAIAWTEYLAKSMFGKNMKAQRPKAQNDYF